MIPTSFTQPALQRFFSKPSTFLLFQLLLVVFIFLSGFFYVSCIDIGFHLRTGELVVSSGTIPSHNTFSFATPEQPWLLHQWAPAVVYWLTWKLGGVGSLIIFKALLAAALFWIVWLSCTQESERTSWWPFWVVTLAVILARVRFLERPFLFSALFLALLLYLSRQFKASPRWKLIGLPLFMALWANVHAGVLYGFVLLALWCLAAWVLAAWESWQKHKASEQQGQQSQPNKAAGELRQALTMTLGVALSIFAAAFSVWLINPSGPQVLMLPLIYFFDPFWHQLIVEFHPPTGTEALLLFGIVALILVLQALSWRRFNLPLFLAFAVFAILAAASQRILLMFAIVFPPYLAFLLEGLLPARSTRVRFLQAVLLPLLWLLVVLVVIVPGRTFRFGTGLYPGFYPIQLYDFLKSKVPPQHLYNDMRFGGSMLWFLYPEFRPFIDGRCEAYSREFWSDLYLPLSRGEPSWREVFRDYQITGALVPTSTGQVTRLAVELKKEPRWALVAFNDHAILFLERTESNLALIQEHEYHLLWPGDWSLEQVTTENTLLAIEEAQRALNLAPSCLFARTALARAHLVAGNYQDAVALYAEIIHNGQAGANYWRDYGYSLYMLERWHQSEQVFQTMIARDWQPAFAHYMLHFLALRKGETLEARRLLEKAVQLEPHNCNYRNALDELNGTN